MQTISVSEQFNCSPEAAFLSITDFPNAVNYMSGLIKVEMLTDGPVGVGTIVRETRKMFGNESSETMTVIAYDSPNEAVLEANSHGARYISTYVVVPDGDGAIVTMKFDVYPQTFMAKIMGFMMSAAVKSVSKMLAKDLADAKHHAESQTNG